LLSAAARFPCPARFAGHPFPARALHFASGGPISFSSGKEHSALRRGSLLPAAAKVGLLETYGFRTSAFLPPAAPFLSTAKEMGERTPPKTHGFWISFRRLPPRSDSSEMLNRRISLSAVAFTLKCAGAQFYQI